MQYNISVRKKDKGYQVIVSYKDGMKWKQKSKQGFNSKKEAKIHGDDIIEELKKKSELNTIKELEGITFGEYRKMWLDRYKNGNKNTYISYKNVLDKFSTLDDLRLDKINQMHIEKIYHHMDYSVNTKKKIQTVLKLLFREAVEKYSLIPKIPFKIEIKKEKREKKIKALSKEELNQLLKDIKEDDYTFYIQCLIASHCGLRKGELIALTVNDIDFKNNLVHINKQVQRGEYEFLPLKSNNSYRDVPMSPLLNKELKEYLKVVGIDKRLFKSSEYMLLNYKLKKYNKDITTHCLRHTYATLLLANNVDIKTVSALLGDTVEIVINTYVHYTDEMRKKAQEKIASIF